MAVDVIAHEHGPDALTSLIHPNKAVLKRLKLSGLVPVLPDQPPTPRRPGSDLSTSSSSPSRTRSTEGTTRTSRTASTVPASPSREPSRTSTGTRPSPSSETASATLQSFVSRDAAGGVVEALPLDHRRQGPRSLPIPERRDLNPPLPTFIQFCTLLPAYVRSTILFLLSPLAPRNACSPNPGYQWTRLPNTSAWRRTPFTGGLTRRVFLRSGWAASGSSSSPRSMGG
jgi:hypothetical protein